MPETWRDLVPLEQLAAWMDRQGLPGGDIEEAQPLTGGTQNVLVRFRRGGRYFVLRRPPRHAQTDGNASIRREARILAALAHTGVPHPRLIAAYPESDVLGAAFYLMEAVHGFNAHAEMPPPHNADATVRRRMGLALADAIASLAQVDPLTVGLGDFGRPAGFLARQVERWRAQLDSYHKYAGWPGATGLKGVETVAAWIGAHLPGASTPGILHGDFHLANVLFRFDSPQIAAIVDWELATVGDPLLDLGWLLAHWPNEDGEGIATTGARPWTGFPTRHELIDRYSNRSTRDLSAVRWYSVLACFKRAVIIEGTFARACAGVADRATGERLHGNAVALVERAQSWFDARW